MSEQEDFLKRWSRRKQEVAEEKSAESDREKTDVSLDADAPPSEAADANAAVSAKDNADKADVPAFDISKLPSIESITAETDIRPFLAKGVPTHLTQAALRQVWVADPTIRNFMEVAENQWDFNAAGVPGFDLSLPDNVKELVAQIFAKTKDVVEKAVAPEADEVLSAEAQSSVSRVPAQLGTTDESGSDSVEAIESADAVEPSNKSADSTSAEQQTNASDEVNVAPLPRRHGGALPT